MRKIITFVIFAFTLAGCASKPPTTITPVPAGRIFIIPPDDVSGSARIIVTSDLNVIPTTIGHMLRVDDLRVADIKTGERYIGFVSAGDHWLKLDRTHSIQNFASYNSITHFKAGKDYCYRIQWMDEVIKLERINCGI